MTVAVMAANRELRHVAADFDWPLNKVWKGYLTPDELELPECPDCERGYSVWAMQLERTFYRHMVSDDHGHWNDKLTQADVDHLLERGRLRTWTGPDTRWQTLPLTAEFVNQKQRERTLDFQHDAINRHILIERRCKAIGAPYLCPTCEGSSHSGTPEQVAALDAWSPYDPPTGDHLQVWETTSEGSPISPVFPPTQAGREAMVGFLVRNGGGFTTGWTAGDWDRCLESSWPSLDVATGKPVHGGVA